MSVYAVSDLHGCWNHWLQIKNFLKEEDKLYILGDCIDRQDSGLAILKEALADSRMTVLCGNHEDMMREALIAERDFDTYDDIDAYRWFNNGGRWTYYDWQEQGNDYSIIEIIGSLPLWAEYINQKGQRIVMNHSGAVPKISYDYDSLLRRAQLWDRNCIKERRWHRDENEFLIHGHTPIPLMPQFEKFSSAEIPAGAFWYCDMHKCNIDNGGFATGDICMLDLDTFEEHIFTGE